jgi:hypothetical protein
VCTRATSWPARWASAITARIWSSVIPDESSTMASGRALAMIAGGTSDPVYSTTGQLATSRAPRTVISSGSPGPAPMM